MFGIAFRSISIIVAMILGHPAASAQSRVRSEPRQLRYSGGGASNSEEERLAEQLTSGAPSQRVSAADALWRGHSLKYAEDVLQFLANGNLEDKQFQELQTYVRTSLQPKDILWQMKKGDYRWGAWLSFLQPHRDLVPTLIETHKSELDYTPETVLALGKSRDARARDLLIGLLTEKHYRKPGDAAQALGLLGDATVEPALLEVLSTESVWVKVRVCRALGIVGSDRAIKSLKRIVEDKTVAGGELNVARIAQEAIENISKRQSPQK